MKKFYTIVFLGLLVGSQVHGQSCDNYTNGGKIFQNVDTATIAYCNVLSLLPMTEVIAPSGGSGGSPIYQWQVSLNLGNSWIDIAISEGSQRDLFANSNPVLNYLIGIGLDPNQTTIFRRAVRRSNCIDFVYSNWVIFKVFQQITDPGHFRNLITQCEINGNNFCTPAISPQQLDQYIDPTVSYLPTGGSAPYEYRWEISVDDFNWSYYSNEALPDLCFAPGVRRFFRRGVRPLGSPCNFLYSNSIEIRNVMELVIDFTITHPECSDENTGIIEVYDLSGNDNFILSTFQYSIDNGQTWQPSNIFSNLPSGDYNIEINSKCACDNPSTSECIGTTSIVSSPTPFFTNVTYSDLTDCGADDGTISIVTSGGIAPLQYSIDGFTWTNNPNFTGLPVGTYFIFVKNSDDSCERYYGQIELSEPSTPTITSISTVDLTDCNSEDGRLTIVAAGDFGNFEYSIDGGFSWLPNATFSGLAKASYVVGVRNIDGTCPVFQNAIVDGPTPPMITNIVAEQPSDCNIDDGTIVISATPGSGQVFFSIDGTNSWQASGTFSGLPPGTYSIAVRNGNGTCIVFEPSPVQLDYPPAPTILSVDSSQPTNCNVDDGTITITAADGIGNFEFSIDGGSSWQASGTFSGLPPGTYSIAVRNANGTCIVFEPNPVQLDYPPAPSILSANNSQPTDCNVNDGTIIITAADGIGAFEYSIDGGSSWQASGTFSGLPPGTYSIAVRNANGTCIVFETNPVQLDYPPAPSILSVDSSQPTDCNVDDGTIIITAADGIGAFEYSIDGGSSWQASGTFSGLPPGTYSIAVRNANGTCVIFEANPVQLDYPPAPSILSINSSQPSDCNVDDGTITITAADGIGIFEFSIDGGSSWQASDNFSGLPPDTYSIAVRNANGTCIVFETSPVQLDYPPAPSIISVDSSQPTDCNVDDGTISITATDGIGAFEYSIDGGSSWQASGTFSGLPPGSYSIAVRNANGTCTVLEPNPVQLDYPPAPSILSVDSSQPTDCNVDDGMIIITATDGIGAFEFSIDGGSSWQASGTFSGLPPGTYSIAVRNANGTCVIFEPNLVQLDYPPTPSILSVDSSQPTDCNVNDGTIIITATDGIGAFEYSIDGGNSWQVSSTFSGLPPGTYFIAVRNANETCIVFEPSPVQLDYPPAPSIISVDSSQPSDCNVDDGTITITAADGIGIFDFSIDGGNSWHASGTFSGLPPGTYSIAVRNANGTCIVFETNPVQLDYPPAPSILNVDSSQPTNCNVEDGAITITAADGIGAFEYSIDGGNSWQVSSTFSGLPPGTYFIAVRNANETCIVFEPSPVQLDYPPAPSIISVNSSQPTDCNVDDGTLTITATDGIGAFEYSIDGGNSWQVSSTFSGLPPGTYFIAVRNANGTCIVFEPNPVQLDYPPAPSIISVNSSQPTDCHVDDGTLTITATDGIGAFEYSIDGGNSWQVSSTFSGLPPSSYSIAVRNANGTCIVFEPNPVQLDYPPAPSILSVDSSQPTDCNVDDGSITITAADGIGIFEFSIDGGSSWQASGTFSGLPPGSYSIAVRNANATCIVFETNQVQLDYPPAPSILSIDSSQPTDCHVDDGTVIITATDGIGVFEFSIDGGNSWQASGTFSGLPPGTYSVAVRNANGTCIVFETNQVQLDYPPAPSILSINSSQPTDCNVDDGAVTITATDGIGAFEYSIDGGSSWQGSGIFSGLPPGTYSIAVRNGNGTCVIFEPNPMQLDYPPAPSILSVDSSQPTDCNVDDGTISITTVDGIGAFEYSIDGGNSWQASGTFSGLPPGTYSIAVRNANGTCVTFEPSPVQLDYPPAPSIISVDSSQPTDCNVDDGAVTITATDGIGAFEFSIDGGNSWQVSSTFSGLSPGTYSIAVRNANGTCIVFEPNPTQLDYPPAPSILSIDTTQPTDCNVDDGTIIITAADGIGAFEFSIDGGNSWQASGTFSGLPPGSYSIAVRNANGTCIVFEPNPVQLDYPPAPEILMVLQQNPSDCGINDGVLDIQMALPLNDFLFSINGGQTWQTNPLYAGLGSGIYHIMVTNGDGTCLIDYGTIQLTGPSSPLIDGVESFAPTDCGGSDGSILIQASGGSESFQYSINGGTSWSTSPTFNGLPAGTYPVVVRNLDGSCEVAIASPILLEEPQAATILNIIEIPPSDCELADGSIQIIIDNDPTDFEFTIDNGENWTNSNNFDNLSAGQYLIGVRRLNGACETFMSGPVILNSPVAPVITNVLSLQPSDCDLNDGSIQIMAASGIGSYEYSINGGTNWQANNLFPNLPPGQYQIMVRNITGSCSISYENPVELTYPNSPMINDINSTPVSDCGNSDASITIIANRGIPPLQYSIDGGASWSGSALFTNLPVGSYPIAVSNQDGTCIQADPTPVIILELPQPEFQEVTFAGPTDCGLMNGTISVNATTPIGAIEFSIDGGESWSTDGLFNSLAPGTYQIYIRNQDGTCTTVYPFPVVLEEIPSPEITGVSVSQPLGCGIEDGTIHIQAQSNAASLQYSIDGGENWQFTATFENLSSGTYTPSVQYPDGTCITFHDEVLLFAPDAPIIIGVSTQSLSDCGITDGQITVQAEGGSGTYLFSIDGGQNWQSNGLFQNLIAGIYQIQVQNADGSCPVEYEATVQLTEPLGPEITSTISTDPSDCGIEDGTIIINANGGSGNYQYSLDGITWEDNHFFNNLSPGVYFPQVRNLDGSCPVVADSIMLISPEAPVLIDLLLFPPENCTESTGTIDFLAQGTAPLQYSIDGGQSWQDSPTFNNLPIGQYQIALANANGTCVQYPGTFTLGGIGIPAIDQVLVSNPTDCDTEDGIIIIEAVDNNQEFLYSIDGGTSWMDNPNFNDLPSDIYTVMISNLDTSCAVLWSEMITLSNPASPAFDTVTTIAPTGCGFSDGNIIVDLIGQEAGFEFSLDQGTTWQSNPAYNNLPSGNYLLLARNEGGQCITEYSLPVRIENATEMTDLAPVITGLSSCHSNDGTILIEYPGQNLEYSIDGGITWQSENLFASLAPNSYTIMVSDSNSHCYLIHEFPVIIDHPNTIISLEIETTNTTECQEDSGSIIIHPPNNEDYLYSIDGGVTYQENNSFFEVPTGTYTPTILSMDSTCSFSHSDTVQISLINNPVIILTNSVNPDGCDIANGAITVEATGETNIEYSLDLGASWQTNDGIFDQLLPGSYTIWIRNEGSPCMVVYPTIIELVAENNGQVEVDLEQSICQGESFQLGDQEYTEPGEYNTILIGQNGCDSILHLSLMVNDTFRIAYHENICPGEFVIVGEDTLSTTGFHQIDLISTFGCDSTIIINLDVIPSDTTLLNADLCPNESFEINDSLFTETGDYYLTEINEFGCNDVLHLSLTALPGPTFDSISVTAPESCESNNGAISFWGLPSNISLTIDSGMTWQSQHFFEELPAGTYPVTLRDTMTGCAFDTLVQLVGLSQPGIANIEYLSPSFCGDENGEIIIEPSTGSTFLFSIDGGQQWQPENIFENLGIGQYQVLIASSSLACFSDTTNITLEAPIDFSILLIDSLSPSCNSYADGHIEVNVEGQGDYDYVWNDGSIGPFISGLGSGNYTLTVTDQNGCSDSLAIALANPPPFFIDLPDEPILLCPGQSTTYPLQDSIDYFEWSDGLTVLSINEDLLINHTGVYYFLAENDQGCLYEDSLEVLPLGTFFSPRFLLPTEGLVGESIFGVEVSWPAPDSIRWLIDNDRIEVVDTFLNQIELQFLAEGTYSISLEIHLGDCTVLLEKEITIYDDPGQLGNQNGNGFSEILEYVLFPNPNTGQFEIRVVLAQANPLQIRIYRDNGVLMTSRILEGEASYQEAFNLTNAPPGNYIAQIQTSSEWRTINFIIQ